MDDMPAVLGLMDVATAWLVQQGRTGQWGDGAVSHTQNPRRVKQFTAMVESGGCWVAIGSVPPPPPPLSPPDSSSAPSAAAAAGEPSVVVGALTVHDAMPYIPPATEPERYVQLLLTHRAWKGRGLGTLLLAKARALAADAGVGLLRVDCYAGGDGKLVRWYESQGFVKTESLLLGDDESWPGQVLEMRLHARRV